MTRVVQRTIGTCWPPKDIHTIKYALRYRFGNRSKYTSLTVFIENRIKLADIMIMMMMMIGRRWLSTLWPLLASAARMSRQCGVYLITSLPRLTVCCPELFSHCQLLHLSARCTAHRVWSEKKQIDFDICDIHQQLLLFIKVKRREWESI